MITIVRDYFSRLAAAFGQGWTSFWFTPTDPTVLGAIRLLTGLVVVYLHATLSLDLIRLFGPDGLLSTVDIESLEPGNFSYLNYLSTPAELWTVHLIGLAVLIAFAAGLWTRLTTVLALVVFLSDVHRAPMITGRTEPIVAMVMLYLCLAPCGRSFSWDRWWSKKRAAEPSALVESPDEFSTTATIATRLIQVHLALLVAMMGVSKLSGDVWWSGTGVWWLIARPESRLIDLTWLYDHPKLLDAWSHAIVAFELGFPLLIWIPLARPLLLAAGTIVWTSLVLLTGDITFGLMLGIASLAFVSPSVLQSCCGVSRRPVAAEAA